MSNKSMLIGMVAGIGVAAAGGVAAYQFMGSRSSQANVEVVEEVAPASAPQGSSEIVVARAEPVVAPAPAPRQQTAAAPRAQTAPRPAPAAPVAPVEECWDEEVTVQLDPKDEHAIAGTAVGAVVGGAIGKDVGDRDLTTAAGAAAGAFIGRKIQKHIQENRAEQRTETHIEHRCAPAGTPH
jgi:uncharacterized protein YcfJ